MQLPHLRTIKYSALLFLTLTAVRFPSAISQPQENGTLAVLVTWGDINNTPANDVYIEAHGYVVRDKAEKSFVFKMVRVGQYEATIPPGIYDVFVSEGNSEPRCKRMFAAAGRTGYWTLKLESTEMR
jgi:hypothetical protein